jgi:hypothetical protein
MFPTPKKVLGEKRKPSPIVPNISLPKNQNLMPLGFFLRQYFST